LGHGGEFPSFIPGEEVEGEEDDQEEKDANGPEKTLPEGVPVLLGIEKHPHGDDQRNNIEKDENETHSQFSQKQPSGFSFQRSANKVNRKK